MHLNVFMDLEKAAQPNNPPRGGKYIKREWTGERWKYTYEGEASGYDVVSDEAVPEGFEGLVQRAVRGIDPEQTYSAALNKALENPGTSFPVRNPALDDELTVTATTDRKGRKFIEVRDSGGTLVDPKKPKGFENQGQYDAWMIGVASTVTRYDTEGRKWLSIVPMVGKVSKSTGELIPSTDTGRRWKVAYHPNFPKELQKTDQLRKELGYASSLDLARQRVDKVHRDLEISTGVADSPAGKREWLDEDDQAAIEAAKKGEPTTFKKEGDSGVAQDLESGKLGWRFNHQTLKRELDVSAEEKEKLIAQLGRDYFYRAQDVAEQFTENSDFYKDHPTMSVRDWQERLIGDRIPEKGERDDHGKPLFVALDPESPTYKAIEQALDRYDPATGVPFGGYLAGEQGKIYWMIRREHDRAVREIKSTSSGTVTDDDKQTKERHDLVADPSQEPIDFDFDDWHDAAQTAISQWEKQGASSEDLSVARQALQDIADTPIGDQQEYARRFSQALMAQLTKSLVHDAVMRLLQEDLFKKALQTLTKDKNVDPAHNYVERQGDENMPRFYYQDQFGNYVRYTNAPSGHEEYSNLYGDAMIHPGEPLMDVNPEYFSPNGQKLTRCPDCDPSEVEWNDRYSRYDPQNMWVGRWMSPENGEYQYTYADADIRAIPKLRIHQQNALTDVRLPAFRDYYRQLFDSDRIKDQMTALALALVDQGRFRAVELAMLTPQHVQIEGSIIQLGDRQIYADDKVRNAIEILLKQKLPDVPLFSVPLQKDDGELDSSLTRRIGPHYLARVMDNVGMSIVSIQTYHATICFSREMQRAMSGFDASWESAKSHALLVAALEWGHDLRNEPDAMNVMQLVEQSLIDPVVIQTLQRNAQDQGLAGSDSMPLPPATIPIPFVSMEFSGKTADEEAFGAWIHAQPIHEHVNHGERVEKARHMSVEDLFDIMKSDGVLGLFDLIKHKYIKREGSPGNYKYTYPDDETPGVVSIKDEGGVDGGGGGAQEDDREQYAISEDELKKELLAMGFVEKLDHLPEETVHKYRNADGSYEEERQQLHNEIIAEALGKGKPVPSHLKPTAVLMMGGPGSGKSSATRGMSFDDFVSVDPDAIKAKLPEYQEATSTGAYENSNSPRALNAAFMAHEESSDVADVVGELAVSQRKNVLFDGTGKNLEKMKKRIEKLRSEGYNIQILMPHIDVNEGKKRAAERAKKTGRWVPFDVLDKAYGKIPGNFMELAHLVDSAKLFDNGGPPGSAATLMYSTTGGVGNVHDENLFNQFQSHVNKSIEGSDLPGEQVNPPMEGEKQPSVSDEQLIEMFQEGLRRNAQDVEENGSKRVGAGPQPLLD